MDGVDGGDGEVEMTGWRSRWERDGWRGTYQVHLTLGCGLFHTWGES